MADFNLGKQVRRSTGRIGPVAGNALRQLLNIGIDGGPGFPGSRTAAASALGRKHDHEAAINALERGHVAMAGAQGFLAHLGGLLTMVATLPANVAAVTVIQTRLVGSIAHLRGYDVDDSRVRSAVLVCLLGDRGMQRAVASEHLPSTPLAVATAPMADPDLDERINRVVLAHLLVGPAGLGVPVAVAKRIPVVGGPVGAVADSYGTLAVSAFGRTQFPARRVLRQRRVNSPDSADQPEQ